MTTAEREHLRAALAAEDPITWVITGDSITHGLVHTQGARNYVDHLHELIRGDMFRTRDTIINTGISGHRVTQILDDFERRITRWQPDIVTLMIGTNDAATNRETVVKPAEFEASVARFVRDVRALGAIPVLQTPPPIDVAHAPERSRIAEFVDAIRAVAERDDVILIDQYARFAELGNGGFPHGLMDDPFHPNPAGHAALALELAHVLGLRAVPERSRVLTDLEARVLLGRRTG